MDGNITEWETFLEYLKSIKSKVNSRINQHGAVLFRGFHKAIVGDKKFNDFVEALGVEPLPYVGGAEFMEMSLPRTNYHLLK